MRAPVSWLRDFVATDAPPSMFADVLTARGFTVDAVDAQPMPDRIVVGRIDTLGKHPNADKLLVGSVDVGTGEKVQIVTGASNVKAGDVVPIALAGSVVFTGALDARGARETKAIQPAKLRGVESNGMMASAGELALPGDYEDGILIMDPDTPVGGDFWKAVRFGDAVLDVDVPSNRPDCLSIIGLAREAAAGLGARFIEPAWGEGEGDAAPSIKVEIGDASVCRRLQGQLFTGASNGRSPLWMVLRLQAAGVRALSRLVDISNYVQIETGQPLHFYDARRIRGGKIVARGAAAGESVVTLDGVSRALAEGTPVIADGERLVGIAGIFGGADSSVADDTTDVYVESPNFVGPSIRRASIALGLRTEGATRHERGLPLELVDLGRRRAAELLIAAGARPSAVVETGEKPGTPRSFAVRPARVNALLGADYPVARMKSAIEAVGIRADGDDPMRVTVPWWRPDVVEEVDIIEEVARGLGFDGIEPRRAATAPQSVDDSLFGQEQTLARGCAALGYTEIVSLALQGSRIAAAWERSGVPFWRELAVVRNPLSDEQRFLRPSLLPGLLAAAERAWPRAGGALRLFEVGHVFRPLGSGADDGEAMRSHNGMYADNGVAEWPSLAGLACFAGDDGAGAIDPHLLAVKGDVQWLIDALAGTSGDAVPQARAYLHPGAAADVRIGDATVAKFGRIHPRLAGAFELPATTYAFILYMEALPRSRPIVPFVPLPRYPGTRRDIAVTVPLDVDAASLTAAVRAVQAAAFEDVFAFDEYTGPQVAAGKKSVALAVTFRRADATITDAEADAALAQVVAALAERFGATLRGPAAG